MAGVGEEICVYVELVDQAEDVYRLAIATPEMGASLFLRGDVLDAVGTAVAAARGPAAGDELEVKHEDSENRYAESADSAD